LVPNKIVPSKRKRVSNTDNFIHIKEGLETETYDGGSIMANDLSPRAATGKRSKLPKLTKADHPNDYSVEVQSSNTLLNPKRETKLTE
jgi:hypothetical protein